MMLCYMIFVFQALNLVHIELQSGCG